MDARWIEGKIQELEASQFSSGPKVTQTGVSLAIVREGRLGLTHARGWANRASRIPVTAGTIFPIASVTKAFSAALLAQEFHERGIRLDHPVRELLPEFSLASEEISGQITPIDLLAHRCGIPRHDALWYRAGIEGSEILERLRYLELLPASGKGFRQSFQYNNLMYGVAGWLLERVTGRFWSDGIEEKICAPLGMSRTTAFAPRHLQIDRALPYFRELPGRDFLHWGCAPAGAMHSTASDLALWVEQQIARGKSRDGKPLIDESLFESALWKPWNDAAGTPEAAGRFSRAGYGLGWFIDEFSGHRLIHHGGSITGFSLHASFMPDRGLGVVILVNQVQSRLARPLASAIYSQLLGIEEPHYNPAPEIPVYSRQTLLPLHAGEPELSREELEKRATLSEKKRRERISALSSQDWVHPGYGRIQIRSSEEPDCDVWVTYENSPAWKAVVIDESTIIARVEWLGMPCRLRLAATDDQLRVPFNLNPGCEPIVFRPAKGQPARH